MYRISSRMSSILPVVCTVSATSPARDANEPKPAHHASGGKGFINPWPSFKQQMGFSPTALFNVYKEWKSHPIPPKEQLPQVLKPDWGRKAGEDSAKWDGDIKSTWLGHACFLVELPKLPEQERGARILFDPVFSCRCSPSQLMGPKRVTEPPFPLKDLPHVDAVVLSHNHYDHTDTATLQHIFKSQPKGSVHFFTPLGNLKWFKSIGIPAEVVDEMDWWEERDLAVTLPVSDASKREDDRAVSTLRVTATPCQHFTGRSLLDRFETLWASWAVQQVPSAGAPASLSQVWFAGDTGYRTVPRGFTGNEDDLPHCPAFAEIGSKFGHFDLSHIPIGAYLPRFAMSPVHCSPADSVHLHLETNSRKSIGMHWGTWVLTCEEMTEPPKQLRIECDKLGITPDQFNVTDIGQTTRVTPEK